MTKLRKIDPNLVYKLLASTSYAVFNWNVKLKKN